MKKILFLAVLALATLSQIGCTKEDDATRVLQNMGFTNIQMTGYKALGLRR